MARYKSLSRKGCFKRVGAADEECHAVLLPLLADVALLLDERAVEVASEQWEVVTNVRVGC